MSARTSARVRQGMSRRAAAGAKPYTARKCALQSLPPRTRARERAHVRVRAWVRACACP